MVRSTLSTLVMVIALAAGFIGPGCAPGDSVEHACETREDCPRPDRQICEESTGLCVGFTSLPGAIDGGDGEGSPDGGLADAS